jgi:hypothetical protein
MEEQRGSVLEKDDDDDELDADGRPKKDKAPVTNKKIPVGPHVIIRSFDELSSARKSDKSEEEETEEPETETTNEAPEVVEDVPPAAPDFLHAYTLNEEAIDLRQLKEMEGELDLSVDRTPERVPEPEEPPERLEQSDGEELIVPRSVESHEPQPEPTTEQPVSPPEAPEAESLPPPAPAEGGGSGHEPPRGPEEPPAPGSEPAPERPPLPPELPPTLRPELAQQAQAFDPNTQQERPPQPAAATQERVVERGGGALIAMGVDWFGRRRLRKRQAKQEKRMDKIERAQAEARDLQYRNQIEQTQQAHQLQQEVANRPTLAEVAADRRRQPPPEHVRSGELPAQPIEKEAAPATSPEKAAVSPEHAPSQPVIEEEPVVLPPEHHMVHSEWHSIEVDKFGHPVEKPVLEYGQEFKREQHQETHHQGQLATAELVGYSAVNTQFDAGQQSAPASSLGLSATPPPPQAEQLPLTTTTQTRRTPATSATDLALWITLILIILAIVATLILR